MRIANISAISLKDPQIEDALERVNSSKQFLLRLSDPMLTKVVSIYAELESKEDMLEESGRLRLNALRAQFTQLEEALAANKLAYDAIPINDTPNDTPNDTQRVLIQARLDLISAQIILIDKMNASFLSEYND